MLFRMNMHYLSYTCIKLVIYILLAFAAILATPQRRCAFGACAGSVDMAAADGNSRAGAAKRRRALPGKTTQGSAKKQKCATTKKASAHPVQKVSALAQPAAVLIKAEPAEAAPARMPRRPARGKVDAASPQLPATGTAAAPATPAHGDSPLNGAHGEQAKPSLPTQVAVAGIQGYTGVTSNRIPAMPEHESCMQILFMERSIAQKHAGKASAVSKHVSFGHAGRSRSRQARHSADGQQPASASKDAAGPMPSVIAATSAAEARPAGGTAQGAAAAELAELRVREMSCSVLPGIGEQHNTRGTPQTKVPVTGTQSCKVPLW